MYPSTLSSFTYPNPTDKLNSPSHSSIETAQSSAIGQIEAVLGVDGANSVIGTLMSDVRNPDSDGGGHVQTALKGGTGQITYAKGDLLVAKNSSTLSKLTVGANDEVIIADSTTATGFKWATSPSGKIEVSGSVFAIAEGAVVGEVSVLSVTIPGSTLGTNNAVRARAFMTVPMVVSSVVARVRYSGNVIASVMLRNQIGNSVAGILSTDLISRGSVNTQRGILRWDLAPQTNAAAGSVIALYDAGSSSVESSANQTIGLTVMGADTTMIIDGYEVEKIT